ncbi:MAG: DUF998 domain-containing protein [Acidimicrobiia bacterium]|nr:DUF998 domain-containing protein [Acidimicrobiia bacterium]
MRRGLHLGALTALMCCVACVGLLHVLRPDLPPVAHRLSEYATGPYGWVMTLAFVALGVGLVALGAALRPVGRAGPLAWVLPVAALVGGVGAALSAAFRAGAPDGGDVVHSWASLLLALGVLVVAGRSLPALAPERRTLADPAGAGLVSAGAVLLLVSTVLHDSTVSGLAQRLLWGVLVGALLRQAWHGATGRAMADGVPSPDLS